MSDETTRKIIDKITVRFDKPTLIPTGQKTTVFYDCFKLTPNDMARLASIAIGHIDSEEFDCAVGIAYGGIFFAAAVAGGREVSILQKDNTLRGPDLKGKKVVIVDDVCFEGMSFTLAKSTVEEAGGVVVGFVCIVDRSINLNINGLPIWAAYSSPTI